MDDVFLLTTSPRFKMLVADRRHSVLKGNVIVGVEQLDPYAYRPACTNILIVEPTTESASISYFSFAGLRKP
jgi:hypothetical protein